MVGREDFAAVAQLVTLKDGRVARLLEPPPVMGSKAFLVQVEGEEMARHVWQDEFTAGAEELSVIFLDMDGVLNNSEWNRFDHLDERFGKDRKGDLWWVAQINPEAVGHLNRIIKETGAKVVISSSWRHSHTPKAMQALLDAAGFNGEVIDQTPPGHHTPIQEEDGTWFGPKMSLHPMRGHEIAYWLHLNPRVTKYVILDDDSDFEVEYEGVNLATRHVKTYWQHWARYPEGPLGLHEGAADRAIELLSK